MITGRIRVVLADDHPVMREGIARALRDRDDLELVGEAGDGRKALELLLEQRPQVALLDMRMPELDGLAVLRETEAARVATRVVFLSAFVEASTVYAALEAGAAGFLSKDATRGAICDALAAAARGETVLTPGLQAGLAEQIRARTLPAPAPGLSERERQVLALTAEGLSGPQIAERLIVAPTTVKSHLHNVYEKLGVSDRASAVAQAMRRGLLE